MASGGTPGVVYNSGRIVRILGWSLVHACIIVGVGVGLVRARSPLTVVRCLRPVLPLSPKSRPSPRPGDRLPTGRTALGNQWAPLAVRPASVFPVCSRFTPCCWLSPRHTSRKRERWQQWHPQAPYGNRGAEACSLAVPVAPLLPSGVGWSGESIVYVLR